MFHNWCNKGRGMCYPVCGMVHVKDPLLLIENSSPCGSSRFPLLLSELSFTICLMPYNRKICWSVSLNKTTQIARKETRCHHMGYSFRLAASVLLYASSHRQDNTYHGLCYISCGALTGTRNSSMGSPHE